MSREPLVTVVVPVFDGERHVCEAVSSVLAQTYANLELILVNDGSTDGTRAALEPYLVLDRVRYLEQARRGPGAARNLALAQARGEIVAFLDHDDTWLPEKLELQIRHFLEHPDVGLVHGRMVYMDESGTAIAYQNDWVGALAGECFVELFGRNRIGTSTVAVSAACLAKVGRFSETLSRAEDYELWLRLAKFFRFGFIDRPIARYRVRQASWSNDLYHQTAGELWAIESTLERFPETPAIVGRQAVRARLHQLHAYMGRWLEWRFQDYRLARAHYWKAWQRAPSRIRFLYRALACRLTTPPLRRAINWYLRRLTARERRP